jgi:hypothetical protein
MVSCRRLEKLPVLLPGIFTLNIVFFNRMDRGYSLNIVEVLYSMTLSVERSGSASRPQHILSKVKVEFSIKLLATFVVLSPHQQLIISPLTLQIFWMNQK